MVLAADVVARGVDVLDPNPVAVGKGLEVHGAEQPELAQPVILRGSRRAVCTAVS